MTLTITDHLMTSDHTAHTARLAPGHQHAWHVSWLPGQLLDRNTATTAMIFADTAATTGLHPGHRLWPHLQGWAAELGLTTPDAITRASGPPEKTSSQEPRTGTPGPENPRLLLNGQPVMEGDGGQLAYDCEPHTKAGCLFPNPEPEAGQ
jgi:hypothetical protein